MPTIEYRPAFRRSEHKASPMSFFASSIHSIMSSQQPLPDMKIKGYASLRSAGDAAAERAALHGVAENMLPREISSGFYAVCSKSQKAVMAATLRTAIGVSYAAASDICDVSVIYAKQAQKILDVCDENVAAQLKNGKTSVNRELKNI